MNNLEIYKEVSKIAKAIKVDTGGGCQIPKAALMAKLAIDNDLKTFVEIGVYRGRSFFPMAKAMQITGGHAYGIDPYTNEDAHEDNVPAELEAAVRVFFAETDFPSIYPEVVRFQIDSGLQSCSTIFKTTSREAVSFFISNKQTIDMLHIDGNHEFHAVQEDFLNYFPLLSDNGFIVFDDTDWETVRPILNESMAAGLDVYFAEKNFTILQKQPSRIDEKINDYISNQKLESFYYFVENCSLEPELKFVVKNQNRQLLPTISVLLISYNHSKYLPESLEGILSQTGNFILDLIVGDDSSTDDSLKVILDYLAVVEQNPFINVQVMKAEGNLGLEKNYKRCFKAVSGDYFAICEGDDYWLTPHKLGNQLSVLQRQPGHVICFNDLIIYEEEKQNFIDKVNSEWLGNKISYTISDLIRFNFIGNFSACFYSASILKHFPDPFFDLQFADWFFNIFASQWGFIARIKEPLSVYRQHNTGLWTGKSAIAKNATLYDLINVYNAFLGFKWDKAFRSHQKLIQNAIPIDADLMIFDDSFIKVDSGFRYSEFADELRLIPGAKLSVQKPSSEWSDNSYQFDSALQTYKQNYPDRGHRIIVHNNVMRFNAKLGYCNDLNNAYNFLDTFNANCIPFVFTLHPGGGFGLNDPDSDQKLSRICSSPYFQKVIVTQTITRDYLIERNFCDENQIELIFGCVIPESLIQRDIAGRPYYLDGKDTFDLCFAAHKYSQFGLQKGYDIFIDVAHKLATMYPQIHFHVIGGFDENTFDVQNIRSNIHFYGAVDSDRLQEIFNKMDIILAPNMNDLEFSGTFDGFPTASCITAGLSGSAIFCTDPLGLNQGYFVDHEEIEIVPHDSNSIVAIIENYFHNPEALVKLAARGREKIVQLYSREGQIEPRIAILNQLIAEHSVIMEKVEKKLKENRKVVSGMPSSSLVNQAGESTSIEQTEPEPGFLTRVKRKMRNALRYMRYAPLIKRSGFFDAEWYTVRNPDVRHSALSPLHHFILFGGNEGRDPSPYFNSGRYLDAYPDVALAGQNPLIHFLKFGRFEGRNPRP